MGLSFNTSGSYKGVEDYLNHLLKFDFRTYLDQYGKQGVEALANAVPKDSGLAASSWTYKIETGPDHVTISWHNIDVEHGFPVAIMLQYGYATGTGGYVHGRNYINPAMKPIFDEIADNVRKVVSK